MKRVNSRVVWQGSSWRLRVETVALANGRLLERGAIQHPGAVVLVPLQQTPHGPQVLMLRQYRHAIDATIWELPAGTRGWDEKWLVCAQRELREETGYRAAHFAPLGEVWPVPGLSNERMAIYLATELTADPLPADVDEMIEVQPMPLAELIPMAQNGRLQDAKSIIGILWTAIYLKLV